VGTCLYFGGELVGLGLERGHADESTKIDKAVRTRYVKNHLFCMASHTWAVASLFPCRNNSFILLISSHALLSLGRDVFLYLLVRSPKRLKVEHYV
jgi:hypothetical protein